MRTGWTRHRAASLLTALVLIAGLGCADTSATNQPRDEVSDDVEVRVTAGGKLVYGLGFDVNTWSPFVERWLSSGQLAAQAFYDPLATFAATGEVVPYLAEAIESNEDHTTFTITLRPDVRFHDGAPLDAAAVKLNLDTQGAGTGSNLSPIDGVASVEVVDELTVAVHLTQPWASFPAHLTGQLGNQAGYMTSPMTIEAANPDALPVGTGPFVATEWRRGVSISGVRNPDYWQPGLPHLDEVEFRFLPDEATRLEMVQSGQLDAAQVFDLASVALLLDAEAGDGQTDPEAGGDDGDATDGGDGRPSAPTLRAILGEDDPFQRFVILNTQVAPTDRPELRRALALALDREVLAASLGPGARPSAGIVASSSSWWVDTGYPDHDASQARALIGQIEAAQGPVSLELVGAAGIESTRMLQQIADAWRDVGVDVEVRTIEQKMLPIEVASGQTQAALFDKYSGVDPDTYSMFVLSRNVNPIGMPSLNLAHLDDPAVDEAVDAGRAEADGATRRAAVQRVQELVNASFGYVWLVEAPSVIVASPRVRGIGDTSLDDNELMGLVSGRHFLADVWVAR